MEECITNQQDSPSKLSNAAEVLGDAIRYGEDAYAKFEHLEVQWLTSARLELRDLIDEEFAEGHDVSELEDALRALDELEDNLASLVNDLYDGVLANMDEARDQMRRVRHLLATDEAEVHRA